MSVRIGPAFLEGGKVKMDFTDAVISDAIKAAVDSAQVQVINMSFGGLSGTPELLATIQNAVDNDVVMVAATGNLDSLYIPGPAVDPRVIAVGATNYTGARADFSNYGDGIDVVAPGIDLMSTDIMGDAGYNLANVPGLEIWPHYVYDAVSGTSFAAPQVAGLAALLFSLDESFSQDEIGWFIRHGAKDARGLASEDSVGYDSYHGYGRINAYNSLLLAKTKMENGNFEGDTPNQVNNINYWGNAWGDIEVVYGDGNGGGAYAGFKSLKVTKSGDSGWTMAFTYAGSYDPGDYVTVTAWVKGEVGKHVLLGVYDQSTATDSSFVQIPYDEIPNPDQNEWRLIEIVHEMQTQTSNTPVWVMFAVNGASGGHTAYVDMVSARKGHPSSAKIVAGGFESGVGASVLGWQRQSGSPWAVNNTWPLHNPQYGPQIGLEDSQCMGTQVPESGTGFLMSYPFKVTQPYINFKVCGHNGPSNSGTENKVEFQVKEGSNWVTKKTQYTPGTNDLVQYSWDVNSWIGQEARVCAIDGNSGGGHAWIGVEGVELSDTQATGGGGGNNTIVNGNFDNGFTGWTATGSWKINGAWTVENGYPQPGQIGDFAGSFPPESATGTLTSDTFVIDKDYINFRIGGQDNANANKVRLIVGGNIVKEVGPPGDNGFVDVSWSVSGWDNQSAHIECVDGNSNGGYAWYCVDEFYLSDTPTTTVTKPVVLAQDTPAFRSDLPDTFLVNQNVPNPFNPETMIVYELPRDVDVSLKVYNVLGQEIRSLINRRMFAGRHTIVWNSKDELDRIVSSGIYFYRFIAGPVDETKKMLILK